MQSALGRLLKWAKENGLGVNPAKTELVLFTRRYKIPEVTPPRLDGVTLKFSSEAKYLGVILDSKLSWKRNVEARMSKALCAFYACKRVFGKRWGLKPYIVHWMYTAVIRPILTYGAFVWWRAVDKSSYLSILNKVQRLACLAITGAVGSTPQASLETILSLMPLDIYIKSISAKSALRLRESGELRHDCSGHGTILMNLGGLSLGERSDYIIPVMNFDKNFEVHVPSREDWGAGSVIRRGAISVFTDGSKTETGTGAGFFSDEPGISESIRLPNNCSIFQAEICAVNAAACWIRDLGLDGGEVDIYVDSLAALKALNSCMIRSRVTLDCIRSLALLSAQRVRLVWVPGHAGIPGNELADECARLGSNLDGVNSQVGINTPLGELSNRIDEWSRGWLMHRWATITTCRISKSLWPSDDLRRTRALLVFGRKEISLLVGVLTGHCMIGRMSERMGLSYNDFCRSCLDEEEDESVFHLLCDCPALQERRLKYLGRRFFLDLDCLSGIRLGDLLGFLKSTRWFRGHRET